MEKPKERLLSDDDLFEEEKTPQSDNKKLSFFKKKPKKKKEPFSKRRARQNKSPDLSDYQRLYSRRENAKLTGPVVTLLATVLGALLVYCLFEICYKIFQINEYAGYLSIAAALVVFFLLFIMPLAKIRRMSYFRTNVHGAESARQARKHNRETREKIALHMIDMEKNVPGTYGEACVKELSLCLKAKDECGLKKALKTVFSDQVKKCANSTIFQAGVSSGLLAIVSPMGSGDAVLATVTNLKMIKNLFYLYGYRPSDAKLLKLYETLLFAALASYGIGAFGKSLGKGVSDAIGDVPVLGSLASTLIDASVQGLSNASLTIAVGFQAKAYLDKEYRRAEILDEIELKELEQSYGTEQTQTVKEVSLDLDAVRKA